MDVQVDVADPVDGIESNGRHTPQQAHAHHKDLVKQMSGFKQTEVDHFILLNRLSHLARHYLPPAHETWLMNGRMTYTV